MTNAIDQEKRNTIEKALRYSDNLDNRLLSEMFKFRKECAKMFINSENENEEDLAYQSINHINNNIKSLLGL